MSVCNLYVGADSIMCLSDTMQYKNKKPVGLCDHKTHILSGGQGAWCFRGRLLIEKGLEFLINRHEIGSLDVLEDRLEYYSHIMEGEIETDAFGEITLFGVFDHPSRLRAVRYRFLTNGRISDAQEIGAGVHLRPSPGDTVKFPEVVTEETMVRLALAQQKVEAHFNMSLCIGGVMHLTTATLDTVSRKIVGAYPDYEDHRKKFSCPNFTDYEDFIKLTNSMRVA